MRNGTCEPCFPNFAPFSHLFATIHFHIFFVLGLYLCQTKGLNNPIALVIIDNRIKNREEATLGILRGNLKYQKLIFSRSFVRQKSDLRYGSVLDPFLLLIWIVSSLLLVNSSISSSTYFLRWWTFNEVKWWTSTNPVSKK